MRAAQIFAGLLLLVLVTGCPSPVAENPNAEPQSAGETRPIRILVVDDPVLEETIERQWRARSEQPVEVRGMATEQVRGAARLEADVVIYPSAMLGTLAQSRLIEPFPKEALSGPQLARSDIFPTQLEVESRWGGELYAVPLGSPQLCLLYRPQRLEAVRGTVPTTWAEYQELVERLASQPGPLDDESGQAGGEESGGDESGGDEAGGDEAGGKEAGGEKAGGDEKKSARGRTFAVAEPLARGWAGQLLLARAAAYARHRSQYSAIFDIDSMQPLIAGPPFVRALEELTRAFRYAPPESLDWTPRDVREAFFTGQLDMAMTWPVGAAMDVTAVSERVGFAALPGSSEVYRLGDGQWEPRRGDEELGVPLLAVSGRLGSVTREASRADLAADVLAWVSGVEWSPQVVPASPSTTLYRQSHLSRPEVWAAGVSAGEAAEYAELVQRTQSRSDVLFALRLPGRQRYLAALDDAVRSVVQGDRAAGEALEAAAGQWAEITADLGLETQRDAYTRSLGLQP